MSPGSERKERGCLQELLVRAGALEVNPGGPVPLKGLFSGARGALGPGELTAHLLTCLRGIPATPKSLPPDPWAVEGVSCREAAGVQAAALRDLGSSVTSDTYRVGGLGQFLSLTAPPLNKDHKA